MPKWCASWMKIYDRLQQSRQTAAISAFWMIERQPFDGAVIDKGLNNEVIGLCAELQSLNVPYIIYDAPHDLQKPSAQRRDAKISMGSLMKAMRAHYKRREVELSDIDRSVFVD
jgi:hypothetical protein